MNDCNSLKFASKGTMAWRRISNKSLSEPMLTRFTDAYMQHYRGFELKLHSKRDHWPNLVNAYNFRSSGSLHKASSSNEFSPYPIFADEITFAILWYSLTDKLNDGFTSPMRSRHTISNANYILNPSPWTEHQQIYNPTKLELGSSPSIVKYPLLTRPREVATEGLSCVHSWESG